MVKKTDNKMENFFRNHNLFKKKKKEPIKD